MEARRAADAREPAPVVPIGDAARFDRPAPGLGTYDGLLGDGEGAGDEAGGAEVAG